MPGEQHALFSAVRDKGANHSTIDAAVIWVNRFVNDQRGNRWRARANRDAA